MFTQNHNFGLEQTLKLTIKRFVSWSLQCFIGLKYTVTMMNNNFERQNRFKWGNLVLNYVPGLKWLQKSILNHSKTNLFTKAKRDQFVCKRLETLITLLIREKTSLQNNITKTGQSFLLCSSKTPYLELRLVIDQSILFFCILYCKFPNKLCRRVSAFRLAHVRGCHAESTTETERTKSIFPVLFVFKKQKSQSITGRSTPTSETTVIYII